MSRFAQFCLVVALLGTAAPGAAADLSFRLQGVVPVICDAQPGRVAVSGNRATVEIARACNTEHRLIVTWDAAQLARPEITRIEFDGYARRPGRTADAVFSAPAHFSGSRRLVIESAASDLPRILQSLRIVIQPT